MKAVADSLGMSISTVSRALNGKPGVAPATGEKVRAAAEAMGYLAAENTPGPRLTRVCLAVPWPDVWYYSAVIAGAEAALRRRGIEAVLRAMPTAEERRAFFTDPVALASVDGIVAVSFPLDERSTRTLSELAVPTVSVSVRYPTIPSVTIDDNLAARQAVGQLLRSGHRRIAYIGTVDPAGVGWPADHDRAAGYAQALAAAELGPPAAELVATAPWGVEGGAEAMAGLLSLDEPPTAVFCFSDEVAIGALRTLRRAGVAVPAAMSVIAIDGHPMAELTGLTTISQPVRRLGELAAEQVMALLRGETIEHAVVLPTHLTARHTIAAPAKVTP
ncbi:MAG: LacI family DNA-binding transcriptional regulator [Gordonia sp. (in: high G+C Gram-positive bacteria)]